MLLWYLTYGRTACAVHTVPKPLDYYRTKSMSVDDFIRIAIGAVISKVFEYRFLDRFNYF